MFFLRRSALLLVVLLTLATSSPASARRITADLARTIELVRTHGSDAEAEALRKFFQMEGYESVPLHRSFVDASIGRSSVTFLQRQVQRLQALRRGRPYLDPVIADLTRARNELDTHGYLNRREGEVMPSDRVVLSDYRFDRSVYRAHVRQLTGEEPVTLRGAGRARRTLRLDNRFLASHENRLAETADFLKQYYEDLGLQVELEPFTWRGRTFHNVVVTIPGRTAETVMLGAHYDTAQDDRAPDGVVRAAPGADDNASGIAALMEAAQAFRGRQFEKTIKLVHFAGEEAPGMLRGSRSYAAQTRDRGDPIQAVFILDSIGYNRNGRSRMMVHTDRNERSLFLASEITRASGRLGGRLRVAGRIPDDGNIVSVRDTDSAPFARQGIPTVFVAEDFRWRRGIHDFEDVASRLDYDFAGEIVGATLEAAARVARDVSVPEPMTTADLEPNSALGRYRTRAGRGARPGPTDELVDRRGRIRPEYQGIARALKNVPRSRVQAAARGMHQQSADATEFRAVPRILSAQEFSDVERGLAQVERAMQAALRDIYSGDSRLIREGIVTRQELEAAEGYDDWYVGAFDRDASFDFILRPDLVRDEQGRLSVLELNMGYVGGFGDIARIRRLMREQSPEVFENDAVEPTEDFPAQIATRLRAMAPRGRGRVVFYTVGAEQVGGDREDIEFAAELRRHGVEYVSPNTGAQLETVRGRVFLVRPNGTRERVDVVYSRTGYASPEMEAAHVNGGVRIFPTPGSSVFESKNLYSRIPQIIRSVLGEEPVFRFLESRSFAREGGQLDAQFLAQVRAHPERWVFKAATGAQGSGVVVGRHATPAEIDDVIARVRRNPAAWDAQEFVQPSTLDGEYVDLAPYLVTTNGSRLVPRGAMVRTARGRNRFGDAPRFLDTWVLSEDGAPDHLASGRPRLTSQRARLAARARVNRPRVPTQRPVRTPANTRIRATQRAPH